MILRIYERVCLYKIARCVNFALVLKILIWHILDCSGCICIILFKVGFDLERCLSMCMYVYLLYMISQQLLGEAKILIWPWVQLWL